MKKIKSYKYRIAFGAEVILFLFGCGLLNEVRTNHLFFTDLIRVGIVAIIIVYIWKKFQLGTLVERSYRSAQKMGESEK